MDLRSLVFATVLFAVAACGQPTRHTEETMEPWPFNVPAAELSCVTDGPMLRVFATTPDGRRFAVNGAARSEAPLMTPIQGHYQTGDLIDRGLALCRSGSGPIRLVAPAQPALPDPGPPTYRIQPADDGRGFFVIAESSQIIDGRHPKLTFSCGGGRTPFLTIDFIRVPPSGPPLRGTFGTMTIGDDSPQRLEWSWTGDKAVWTIRTGDDSADHTQLVRAVVRAGAVTVAGPATYTPSEPINWTLADFGESLQQINATCGT